jgi:hypothetical protein
MTTPAPNSTALRLENRHTGEVLEIRRERRNGELVFGLRGTLPAHREGPPMHVHYAEDEEGLIVAGTLSAEVGRERPCRRARHPPRSASSARPTPCDGCRWDCD